MATFSIVPEAWTTNSPVSARHAAVALRDIAANWQEARIVTTLNPGGSREEVCVRVKLSPRSWRRGCDAPRIRDGLGAEVYAASVVKVAESM